MNYVYSATEEGKQYAPEDAVDISPGVAAKEIFFNIQDTVYLVGVEDQRSVVTNINKASGKLFDRPTIIRVGANGERSPKWRL